MAGPSAHASRPATSIRRCTTFVIVLAGIGKATVSIERLVRSRQGKLLGDDQHVQCLQDLAQMDEPSQAASPRAAAAATSASLLLSDPPRALPGTTSSRLDVLTSNSLASMKGFRSAS